VVSAVEPRSVAGRAGLRVGDEILSINNHPIHDVIDVRFYSAEERLAFQVRRGERECMVHAQRRYDEPLGLEFTRPTFDGIRRCDNNCEFCFVAQMPAPGLASLDLRRTLYVRDDDYRHSFLFGNYITLTNLDEDDWRRIGEQHLSPLYVSVHTTDPDLRRRMLRNPAAPDVMGQLRRLASLGVDVHTQIVVVPGLNDGPHLKRSIGDLADLYPAVRSVSVVPVGITKYHRGGCRAHTEDEMRHVFEQVAGWQARLRERLGIGFVYLADEWYLRLGEQVPPMEAYDGLDLTENGVGLVRGFLDRGGEILNSKSQIPNSRLTLVTGTLFAPVLRGVTAELANVEVVPVVNHFFGETVTVAGLLTGRDVVAALRGRDLGDAVVLPAAMFGGPEGQSLDGMWPQEVGDELGGEVILGDELGRLRRDFRRVSRERRDNM